MNRFKRLISTMLSVMMITSLTFGAAWGATPWSAQIRPGVSTGAGQTDFTTDFFIPVAGNEQSVFFLNPHIRFDDNSGNEQNLGLGFRTFLSGDKVILGGNAYYDSMQSKYHNRYGQFGLGMEVLSKWVDFRANYYNPTGSRKHKVNGLDRYSFANTSLVLNEGYEAALRGFDAEVGVMIPGISDVIETRAFIGGFWYDSPISKDLNGWKGRIEIKPSKLINIDVEMRHDQVRGTDTIFGAYLNIPFSIDELTKGGNPFKGFAEAAAFGKGARTMKERMTQKVVRDRYITTIADTSTEDKKTIIKDMIYVSQDNTGDPDQDGSLKHPWESVEAAEGDPRWWNATDPGKGTWVYVFHSNKSHLKNPLDNEHIYEDNHTELADNMVLWGQGYYMNTPERPWKLGGYKGKGNNDLPGLNPILDGDGYGNVITLANSNEIMGLTIQNGEHGIYGSDVKSTGVSGIDRDGNDVWAPAVNIHDNIIQNNNGGNSGIHIENNFQGWEVNDQTFTYIIADNQILNNSGSGIYLDHDITGSDNGDDYTIDNFTLTNTITGNTIDGNSDYGIHVGNWFDDANHITDNKITTTIDGNRIYHDGSDDAVYVGTEFDNNSSGTMVDVTMVDDTVLNNTVKTYVTNNEIINDSSNHAIYVYNGLYSEEDDNVTIADNSFYTEISGNKESEVDEMAGIVQNGDGHAIYVENRIYVEADADNMTVGYKDDYTHGNSFETVIDDNTVNSYAMYYDGILVENYIEFDGDHDTYYNSYAGYNTFNTTIKNNTVTMHDSSIGDFDAVDVNNWIEMYDAHGSDDNTIEYNTFTTMFDNNTVTSAGYYSGLETTNEIYFGGHTYANAYDNAISNNTFEQTYKNNMITMNGDNHNDAGGIFTENSIEFEGYNDDDYNYSPSIANDNTFRTTYDTNTVTMNGSGYGIYHVNSIVSTVDNTTSSEDTTANGNLFTSTFTGNIITINSSGGRDGVRIINEMVMDAYNQFHNNTMSTTFEGGESASDLLNNIITINDGDSHDHGVQVENVFEMEQDYAEASNILFETKFTGVNTINQNANGDGIHITSLASSDWEYDNDATSISFVNDIAGVTINGNSSGNDGVYISDELKTSEGDSNTWTGITFRNTLTGNNIQNFTNDGVHIYHYVNEGESEYSNTYNNISYVDKFTDNVISNNGDDGVEIISSIDSDSYSQFNGVYYTAEFRGNTIDGNDDDGVMIRYEEYYYVNGSMSSLMHNVFMQSNVVSNSGDEGVEINFSEGGMNADLGGGGLGSLGLNSFYLNNNEDVQNDYGLPYISAMNNWWGNYTDSVTFWGDISGNVIVTPWLSADPNP